MAVELKPHQLKALGEMKNGCILRGGVGSGKTYTAVAYFLYRVCGAGFPRSGTGIPTSIPRPVDLYIITTAKKRDDLDWQESAVQYGLSTDPELSIGNVRVVVDSWSNIQKYVDVEGAFFIFDEQRLVGSGAWVKAFYKIAAKNQWVLLTATPGDVWLDFAPVFIAHGFYKNLTEFKRQHVVYNTFAKFPKVDRYVEQVILKQHRDHVLVEMPYNNHTTRHLKTVIVEHNEELFDRAVKKRWHVYEERPLRDVGELFIVMRKIVNSDASRLGAVMKILETTPRLIVFYNFNYELDMLRTLATTTDFEVREYNGHKHEAVPTGDKWVYLVQYTAGAEGWNCITTDSECFYSLTYSYKVFEQAQGRTDRMNTPFVDLYYYVLRSTSLIDQAIAKSITQKQTFNEKKSKFALGFEMPKKEKPVELEVIENHLAKMCIDPDTHERHNWFDGKNTWQCFGGPFSDTQIQIKEQRYGSAVGSVNLDAPYAPENVLF